jgi:hypothetical protein
VLAHALLSEQYRTRRRYFDQARGHAHERCGDAQADCGGHDVQSAFGKQIMSGVNGYASFPCATRRTTSITC